MAPRLAVGLPARRWTHRPARYPKRWTPQFGPNRPSRSLSSYGQEEDLRVYRDLRVAVVVPAHNEELLVGTVVATAPELVDHIIVVDDASSDATSGAAKAIGDPRAEVHRLPENQGVGGAIIHGHKRALELGCDVSVVMAGDAQMDPAYLPKLLDPIADGEAEFTKANRFYGEGSFAGMPRHRVVGNIGMSFLTKAASGYWGLFDPQNGYTAIHRTRARAAPARPARQALRVRERPADQAQRAARPGARRTDPGGLRHRGLRPQGGPGRAAPAGDAVARVLAPDVVEVRPPVVLRGGPDVLHRPVPGGRRARASASSPS